MCVCVGGGGGWKREIVYLSLHCHNQYRGQELCEVEVDVLGSRP